MVDRLTAEPSGWRSRGQTTPVIRIYRQLPDGGRAFVGPLDYRDARALADQIHDACDAHQTKIRNEGN